MGKEQVEYLRFKAQNKMVSVKRHKTDLQRQQGRLLSPVYTVVQEKLKEMQVANFNENVSASVVYYCNRGGK